VILNNHNIIFLGDFMAKYLHICKNCKMDCKDGLQDMKNKPHKIFSFDDYLVRDFWCVEFQYLVHERVG